MDQLLEIPFIYQFIQWLLLPGSQKLLAPYWHGAFSESYGIVLDVGCGPKPTSPEPCGIFVGVDVNRYYLLRYAGEISENPDQLLTPDKPRKRLAYQASATDLPFHDSCADEARAMGLLHHLPDYAVVACVREMIRCVRPGGSVIIFDNVWPKSPWRRPWAWLVRRMDRGRFIRSEKHLYQLLQKATDLGWGYNRFNYTYSGLEGLLFILRKPACLAT